MAKRGRPKKVVKEDRLEVRPSVSGEGTGSPEEKSAKIPSPSIQEAFSTQDIPTASYLEKQGVMASDISGQPLTFKFKPEDSERIKTLLEGRQ